MGIPPEFRRQRRVLLAAMAGTAVEYYDFFLYATAAALVFGPLFFPPADHAAQTLYAFLTFGVAFIARPLGAMVFSHFGDRVGRKAMLSLTLLTMGGSTLAIAFLPTYATCASWGMGWLAPALLTLARFGQGLGIGGEWTGAVLLTVENAPPGWRGRFSAVSQVGIPLGFIGANLAFLGLGLALAPADMMAWGWRIPFVASAVLVGLGLWVRVRLAETAEFAEALAAGPPPRVPALVLLRESGPALMAGAMGAVSVYALFYMASTFALAEATGGLFYDRTVFLALELFASLFLVAGTLMAGWNADLATPGRTVALGAVATILTGLVFWPALISGSVGMIALMLCVAMLGQGFNAGPLGAWMAALFPTRLRYSGVGIAYGIGGVIGGAAVPIAAQAMARTVHASEVGLLLVGSGLLTLTAVIAGKAAQAGATAG